MKWVVACCLVLAPVLDTAARKPAVNLSDDDLLAYLGQMQIEARLNADVTGDGRRDVVYVAYSRNERVLGVIAGGKRTAKLGRRAIGEGALGVSPQASVALGFKNGVLTVEDLSGTDTVTLARYQYRYERPKNRMRLFALVCERYSPTLSHGSNRLSWNLARGDYVVERGQVVTLDTGEEVYVYAPAKRKSRKTVPVYMENAHSQVELFVAETSARARIATNKAQPGVKSP